MKLIFSVRCYCCIALVVLILDRITKWYALTYLEDAYQVTSFLSFDLVMNRGISWSLLHSDSHIIFALLTCFIAIIIALLMVHSVRRWHEGYSIMGEVLTLSGALSNFIDRIIYGGVIDFIGISIGWFSWPVFNLADCCIVCGISLMALSLYSSP